MKHVVLAFLVLVLVAFAGILLWRIVAGACATTAWNLSFAGGALVLAVGLALPTNLKAVVDTVSGAKLPKLGGTP